jgi:phosphoribosylformylglycinamidine synthase
MPLGTTNNLNFGNPEKPHIAWQLSEAVRGLGDACRALKAPIVGGNVSLYNEGTAGPIYPTPVIGMVGAVPDVRRTAGSGFACEGDVIALVGRTRAASLAASELSKLRGEPLTDGIAPIDIAHVADVLDAIREAVRTGAVRSCHDVAEGGLLVALAECALAGELGAKIESDALEGVEHCFGEDSGVFVISGPEQALKELGLRVPIEILGTVGGSQLRAAGCSWTLSELRDAHAALTPLFP